jgi:hypothetical protein
MTKIDKKLRARMDALESRTTIFVSFVKSDGYWMVAMEGEFRDNELAEVASILRKLNKSNVKTRGKSSSKQSQGRLI